MRCETMLRRHVEPYLRALSTEVIVSHDMMTFRHGGVLGGPAAP